MADAFGWKEGLSKTFMRAKNFHLVIAFSTMIGLLINFTNLDPIRALVYSAVINGIVAVPILIALMKVANDEKILNDHVNSLTSNVIGWITVGIMGIAVVILFFTWRQQ